MQLLPENIHFAWRLNVLAGLLLSRSDVPQPKTLPVASPVVLKRLLSKGDFANLADMQEDPYDDVVAEELAFHEGSFLVASGLAENGVPILRNVVRATLLTDLLPADVRRELTRTAAATLHLSDAILRGAGLVRNTAPADAPDAVVVPNAGRLARLAAQVTFSREQLAEATNTLGVEALDPLTATVGGHDATAAELFAGDLDGRPLVRFDDVVIVSKPLSLAVALRHHLVCRAVESVGAEALAEAFGVAADLDARWALYRLGVPPDRQLSTQRTPARPWTELVTSIDTGLQMRCLVIADGFSAVDPARPYAGWDRDATVQQAVDVLERTSGLADHEILGVIVAAGAGGMANLAVRDLDDDTRVAALTLESLSTVCFLEAGDPLALDKWVRASDVITGRVMGWEPLDLYGMYREQERSFYPQATATFVTVMPGFGADQRIDYKTQRDLHGVKLSDGSVREVNRVTPEEADEPIYQLVDLVDRQLVHVAGLPLPVWVGGPTDAIAETWSLVQSVAYWLSELGTPLAGLYKQLATLLPCLTIEARADAGDVAVERIVEGLSATVHFGDPILDSVSEVGNEADRLIVRALVEALDDLARRWKLPGIDGAELDSVVARVVPPGMKKHLIGLPINGNELAEPTDHGPRLVQEADISRVRALVARHLTDTFGLNGQVVPGERRDEVLKSTVGFLFDRVTDRLEASAPDGLLEALVAENERHVADAERRQAFLAPRLATYPSHGPRLREEFASAAQAAICCRFLIEHVTARPPAGVVPWSLRGLDECLALVAEMLDWMYLDDAVYAGLSSADLLIRDDGWLRLVEFDRYEKGRADFYALRVAERPASSASIFPLRLDTTTQDRSERLLRLDEPMAAEAGLNIQGLVDLAHAANHVAYDLDVDVVALPRDEAIDRLSAELAEGTDRAAVARAVDYLSLGPRERFDRPPDGALREVLPSRFARRWSCVRRPFLVTETFEGPVIVWGRRHPLGATRVLLGQLTSGRYQHLADGPTLRAALGTIADETGRAFEARVSDVFEKGGRPTRVGVTRVGGDSLRRAACGRDLGDIDVLVLDRRHRTLWAVECKDLAGAITPGDIVDEMRSHFGDGKDTTAARHRDRVGWLTERKVAALRLFEIDEPAKRWHVRGLFVTGEPVIAPMISEVAFEVVMIDDLASWLSDADGRRRPGQKSRRT